jgi:hypothetical protein
MDKAAFMSRYRDLLSELGQAPQDVNVWVALARHIDGRELNYEECLVSTGELRALDDTGLVRWSSYIWEQVLELDPEHQEALERLVEHRIEVLDDPDGAAPYLESLLAATPEHPQGLHFAVVLASQNDDFEEAQRRMLRLCETSPAAAIVQGTFDAFDEDELTFLAHLTPKLLAAVDAMAEVRGYERSLRALIASLPEGGPLALKRFTATSVPPQVGDLPVPDLELSFSASRCLEAAGVRTVSDIVGLPLAETRRLPLAVVREIKEALEERGVQFA